MVPATRDGKPHDLWRSPASVRYRTDMRASWIDPADARGKSPQERGVRLDALQHKKNRKRKEAEAPLTE
jgi:hypothetical protein